MSCYLVNQGLEFFEFILDFLQWLVYGTQAFRHQFQSLNSLGNKHLARIQPAFPPATWLGHQDRVICPILEKCYSHSFFLILSAVYHFGMGASHDGKTTHWEYCVPFALNLIPSTQTGIASDKNPPALEFSAKFFWRLCAEEINHSGEDVHL